MNLLWLRRDLRLNDNTALQAALAGESPVLVLFIFDPNITDELPANDARISFIYDALQKMHEELKHHQSSLLVRKGNPLDVLLEVVSEYSVEQVFTNRDYEPYALTRDQAVAERLGAAGTGFSTFQDQVIFEPGQVLKPDGSPYTVYTPFKKAWLRTLATTTVSVANEVDWSQFHHHDLPFPTLEALGFERSEIKVLPHNLSIVPEYEKNRDFPALGGTSNLGPHLRFGTVSVREIYHAINQPDAAHQTFLSELIWREFFFQILHHFPHVVTGNFRAKYDAVPWRNDEDEFQRWCEGRTGYPMVDAGMRELNQTGYIHNRVRMVVASFLCKHLLIDWRWGEAYFAKKLLDFELASNNGNWQWCAGTGCDAAPYFRVFNPTEQIKKFDGQLAYVRKWVPEFDSLTYDQPMVDHKFARNRALAAYKEGLAQYAG